MYVHVIVTLYLSHLVGIVSHTSIKILRVINEKQINQRD